MTRWQPYPEYKDSGAPWLGEIPAHWEVANLKYLLQLEYGDSLPADSRQEGFVPVFGSNGPVGTHSKPNTLAPVLIIGRKGSYGKVNFSHQPVFAIDTTYYVDSRSSKADLRWLFYALQLLQLDAFSQDSAVPGLSREFAYQQRVPETSLPEQRAIAAFLDRQTAKIDALISEQRHLIELLQERRAAIISHAVTKGLDPDVPMKDSGIPWIGEIPDHWQVNHIGHVSHVVRGSTPRPAGSPEYFDGDASPWITVAEITKDTSKYLYSTATCLTEEGVKFSRLLSKETFVLTNSGATLGVPKILKISGCINDGSVAMLDIASNVSKDFLYYFFTHMTKNYRELMQLWSGQPNLNTEIVKSTMLSVPDLEEQVSIAAYLDRETTTIDALIAEIETGIAHLKEYRTALISAAVTGQIDVRDALHADAPARPRLTSPEGARHARQRDRDQL